MPFLPEEVRKLREREGLSHSQLARKLNLIAEKLGYDRGYSHQTIYNWENRIHPPIVNVLDVLRTYADLTGNFDLRFYARPEVNGKAENEIEQIQKRLRSIEKNLKKLRRKTKA